MKVFKNVKFIIYLKSNMKIFIYKFDRILENHR